MKQHNNPYRIDVVEVISEGEQVAWVLTPAGGFLVGHIPDARQPLDTKGIIAKANSLDEAKLKFNRMYGIS